MANSIEVNYAEAFLRAMYPPSPLEAFVIAYGRSFSGGCWSESFSVDDGIPCEEAAKLALENNLIYVEGYAIFKGIKLPKLHSWCANEEQCVYDPTRIDSSKNSYFGVPFSQEYLKEHYDEISQYGVIDQWKNGYPILQKHAHQFLHPSYLGYVRK